jgi:hypothetical protein
VIPIKVATIVAGGNPVYTYAFPFPVKLVSWCLNVVTCTDVIGEIQVNGVVDASSEIDLLDQDDVCLTCDLDYIAEIAADVPIGIEITVTAGTGVCTDLTAMLLVQPRG